MRRADNSRELTELVRLLKKLQLQGRREEEPGAYGVVREASGATKKWRHVTSAAETVRRPRLLRRTPQMDFVSSLVTAPPC